MRIPAILLSAVLLAPLAISTPLQTQGPQGGVEMAASSDWERVLMIYKHAQGGAERFDSLRTIAFDYTPWIVNKEGVEEPAPTRQVTVLLRPNFAEQEVRAIRIEADMVLPGSGSEEKAHVVSIVSGSDINVWVRDDAGGHIPIEAREFKTLARFDAISLWAQLDLLLYTDNPELRCKFAGVMTRDSKRFAAVETEFRPGRAVPEPSRLYFSAVSSLIERTDVFDPKTHLRTATSFLEQYADHDGIKFPGLIRFVNRKGEALGSWHFDKVKMNGKLTPDTFKKP